MAHVDLIARPIDVWPGELTPDHQRQHSRFSASWTNTVRMLKSEAGQLGAREVAAATPLTSRLSDSSSTMGLCPVDGIAT